MAIVTQVGVNTKEVSMQSLKDLVEDSSNVWIVAAGTAVVVLGTTLYWLTQRGSKTRIMAKYDYNKQSVLLPVSLIWKLYKLEKF